MLLPNVLETNMPTKMGIYAKYLIDLYEICLHIYVPHMKSLQSTMYTYLTYITENV